MNTTLKTGNVFKMALPLATRFIGSNLGVEVRFGSKPKTDGQTVYLPTVPLDVCEDTSRLFLGHVMHECGHVVYTDFDVVKRHADKFVKQKGKIGKSIFNAIEDPRIEACMSRRYRGGQRYLNESLQVMHDRKEVITPESSEANALLVYLLGRGNELLLNYSVAQDALDYAKSRELVKQLLGTNGFARMDNLLGTAYPALRTTDDAAMLTQDVIDLLDDIKEEQEQQNQNQQQNGGDNQADDSDSDSDSSDEKEDKQQQGPGNGSDDDSSDESDGQPDNSQSESDSSDNGGDDAGQTGVSKIMDSDDVADKVVDLQVAMEEAIDKEIRQQADDGKLETTASTEIRQHAANTLPTNMDRYVQLLADSITSVGAVQRKLERLLAIKRDPSYRGGSRGKLNPKKLYRANNADPNIFRKRIEQEKQSTAVTLLIDVSDSMRRNSKATYAAQAVIATAEACNRAGIPCAIYAFHCELLLIKSFDESLVSAKERLGALEDMVAGTTNMGPALYEAGISMFQRPEQRKLLLTMTDGVPNDGVLVERMVDVIERQGVETFGLGIRSNAVERYFKRNAVIHDSASIGTALMTALSDALLRKAA